MKTSPSRVAIGSVGWADAAAYDAAARKLVAMFADNAKRFAAQPEAPRHAAE